MLLLPIKKANTITLSTKNAKLLFLSPSTKLPSWDFLSLSFSCIEFLNNNAQNVEHRLGYQEREDGVWSWRPTSQLGRRANLYYIRTLCLRIWTRALTKLLKFNTFSRFLWWSHISHSSGESYVYVKGSAPPPSCHICYIMLYCYVSSGSGFLQIGPICSLSCYKLLAPFHVMPRNSGKKISNDSPLSLCLLIVK